MKKAFLTVLIISISIFGQNRKHQFTENDVDLIYSDILYLPGEKTADIYITVRIPYNRLVFEKHDDIFSAGYRIVFEIFRDSTEFVTRQIKEGEIKTGSFTDTDSPLKFYEDFVKMELGPGDYKVLPIFADLKTNREIPLNHGNIRIKSTGNYYQPLVVRKENGCTESEYRLANYRGYIPFSSEKYLLIVPVNSSNEVYNYEVRSNGIKVAEGKASKLKTGTARISRCGDGLYFYYKEGDSENYLVVDPGQQVREGNVEITISNSEGHTVEILKTRCKWFNKPITLLTQGSAARLLKYLDDGEASEKVIDASEDEFDSLLYDFWKKYDPTPETAFNELMNEYYSRADYAAKNFNSISGKTGLESDRGKVYIKFGKPEKVERLSSQNGKIIEVWYYANQKKFSFIDEKGTGDFNLFEG